MVEEILVLGRNKGADQLRRHGFNRNEHPFLTGEFFKQLAVTCMNPGHHGRLIAVELVKLRQAGTVMMQHIEQSANGNYAAEQTERHKAEQQFSQKFHQLPNSV